MTLEKSQNFTYYAVIVLDAFAILFNNNYAQNYPGIIGSSLTKVSLLVMCHISSVDYSVYSVCTCKLRQQWNSGLRVFDCRPRGP